ncbi:glycosyl hydrolase family 32 [Mucilaginibacter sp. PPCGB 2223]|uniref:glycoside hydrolase family 32 protein n=1 Tax=Mucilaginibacter sp. PPCGB 2223 TaxID=1886027 RepID=UPI0008265EDE|nr:glycoside hydrolase family 32 protein [Mucilaginibacter sp. PPCGB 2223]OCX54382.1 glycosyl hydrolase family 32 [Mucilaginibacter sp. PPCGB 2223]
MKNKSLLMFALIFVIIHGIGIAQVLPAHSYNEQYRPQIHFSPKKNWMNDPNGLVYYKGVYHMFFQYYPHNIIWGPMHWGHATSKDMIHWKQQPIALYPDSLGYIFSGSVVVDTNNTTGFGKDGKTAMVAIFTHHDPVGEKAGKTNFENESLAYSLDEGLSWIKYTANPVLKNPGIKDFRDPKVMWYGPQKKWIMTLATMDHITFFSSPDLKDWKKESEFGKDVGAHGGVWECPDLFPLPLNGIMHWVLIVNLNPGGPNGGSATQYFVGDFDGNKFVPDDQQTRWLDYGPDEYAGVTWSNTGNRKIFLGWMSNWEYANLVPTKEWRSAMTIPRELSLKKIDGQILLASLPVKELQGTVLKRVNLPNSYVRDRFDTGELPGQFILKFNTRKLKSYRIRLANNKGNYLVIGYDEKSNHYFIDRGNSGKANFQSSFSGLSTAPRLSKFKKSDLVLVVDRASVELFADEGLTLMTAIYFSAEPYNHLTIESSDTLYMKQLELTALKSIWADN